MPFAEASWITAAALAAGFVNAIAGGGSLLSFPALTAIGLPPVVANVTNTVALTPGYLGATLGQRGDLAGQGGRLRLLLPAAALGGLAGGLLLLHTSASLFRQLVPWLILLGSTLLALQDPLRHWLRRRAVGGAAAAQPLPQWCAIPPVVAASVYGGYFGAGLGVILLAVLALCLEDSFTRLNGLKQPLAFVTNLVAALLFGLTGPVQWPVALLMALAAWLGGALGGRCASRVDPLLLRRLVVAAGFAIGLAYLVR